MKWHNVSFWHSVLSLWVQVTTLLSVSNILGRTGQQGDQLGSRRQVMARKLHMRTEALYAVKENIGKHKKSSQADAVICILKQLISQYRYWCLFNTKERRGSLNKTSKTHLWQNCFLLSLWKIASFCSCKLLRQFVTALSPSSHLFLTPHPGRGRRQHTRSLQSSAH